MWILLYHFHIIYANLFSPNNYKNNSKIIYKYFKDKCDRKSKLRLKKIDETRFKKIDETRNYFLDEMI